MQTLFGIANELFSLVVEPCDTADNLVSVIQSTADGDAIVIAQETMTNEDLQALQEEIQMIRGG